MSNFAKLMQQASAGTQSGGQGNDEGYIAVAHSTSPYLTVLDHTTVGSLSLAGTGTVSTNQANDASFSPDGNNIAVALADDRLALFSFSAGSITTEEIFNLLESPTAVEFSPDGIYLALADSEPNATQIFTYANNNLVNTQDLGYYSREIDWSSDGNYVCFAGLDINGGDAALVFVAENNSGTFTVLDTITLSGVGVNVPFNIAFNPDGDYIAVVTADSPHLHLIDHTTAGSLSLATTYTLPSTAFSCEFSKDGNYLVIGGNGYLTVLDHTTKGSLSFASSVANVVGQIRSVSFSRDGNYLVAGTSDNTAYVKLYSFSLGVLSFETSYNTAGSPQGLSHSQHLIESE